MFKNKEIKLSIGSKKDDNSTNKENPSFEENDEVNTENNRNDKKRKTAITAGFGGSKHGTILQQNSILN